MKYKSIAILIFCASVTPTAFAQSGSEEIGGAGTPNFIARFTGTHKVGNSNIFQSLDGNVGIGTTAPLTRLHVVGDTSITGNLGVGTTTPSAKLDVTSGNIAINGNLLLLRAANDGNHAIDAVERDHQSGQDVLALLSLLEIEARPQFAPPQGEMTLDEHDRRGIQEFGTDPCVCLERVSGLRHSFTGCQPSEVRRTGVVNRSGSSWRSRSATAFGQM